MKLQQCLQKSNSLTPNKIYSPEQYTDVESNSQMPRAIYRCSEQYTGVQSNIQVSRAA
jgi:hypothetical protein